MASFIPICFSSTIWVKIFSCASNLNAKTSAEVHDQHFHHATLLKAAFPFSESFNVVFLMKSITNTVENYFNGLINKMEVVFLNFRYKFYRSFFFPIMTRNFSFSRWFGVIFFKNIWKLTSSPLPCNVEKHTFAIY